ncbi:hypothetical protein LOD99_14355 [Oopsacas minuta]|uniref:Uncharacterized protein n=1 Tax=Oopsacas minuta TaxID=111878 RepID=A0AAV7KFX9_9METZ|nr:hypothetical protein LOD99_14355 [Oopsacas minuta]
MSESTHKKSIELIDAIEAILQHKSCPLSLDYLSLKLQKKYTMKSVQRTAFVNMVHTEISKYPHRIYSIENGLYVLANPPLHERSTLILPETQSNVYSESESTRSDSVQVPGCDEELEIYRLTQEVALLREVTTGCLAWNHSLVGVISDRRRELQEVNTDVNLLLAYHHTMKETKPKSYPHKKKYNKKYGKSTRKLSASGKRNKKRIMASERKHKLKVMSVKKSKLNSTSKNPISSPYKLNSRRNSPQSSEEFPSNHNSQTNSSGATNYTIPCHSPSPTPLLDTTDNSESVIPTIFDENSTSNNKEDITSSDSD